MRVPATLPSEVWTQVFAHLDVTDLLSVRATCRNFQKLIDCASLWKNWTLVLRFPNAYNQQFWKTVRARKTRALVVRQQSSRVPDWKHLAASIPSIATLVLDQSSQEILDCLKNFSQLRRLSVRSTSRPLDLSTVFCRGSLLTHLSLCHVKLDHFLPTLSQLTHLTSLVWHQTGVGQEPLALIDSILRSVPLKHLSLTCGERSQSGVTPVLPAGTHPLTSLELVHCDEALPEDAMKLLPDLQTLVLVYKNSDEQMPRLCPVVQNLRTWLGDLQRLSSLVVVKGPSVHKYARSLPSTLTSLTLRVGRTSEEMAEVASQVPNLLHLHLDPWPSYLGSLTARIPQLFPKLRSLKIRSEHVPKQDFFSLRKLVDLKDLEVLDRSSQLSELAAELQALTDYRVHVAERRPRDPLSCHCVY